MHKRLLLIQWGLIVVTTCIYVFFNSDMIWIS
jgi:hypothetical protein